MFHVLYTKEYLNDWLDKPVSIKYEQLINGGDAYYCYYAIFGGTYATVHAMLNIHWKIQFIQRYLADWYKLRLGFYK